MADPTYNSRVYHEQGSNRFVCASSGSIDVESGGELDIESGGALKIAGVQVTASAAEINQAVESVNNAVSSTVGATGFEAVTNTGTSILSCTGSTATSLCGFRLPAPSAGLHKKLFADTGIDATHLAVVETNVKTVVIGTTTAAIHRLAFNAGAECVHLAGLSATRWAIISNTGAVAESTDFTT